MGGMLVDSLKRAGKYDDTVFVFHERPWRTSRATIGLVEKTQNTFQDCLTHVPHSHQTAKKHPGKARHPRRAGGEPRPRGDYGGTPGDAHELRQFQPLAGAAPRGEGELGTPCSRRAEGLRGEYQGASEHENLSPTPIDLLARA
jgi:hypothetical protein